MPFDVEVVQGTDQRVAKPEFDLTRALRQQVERHGMNPADALETLAAIVEQRAWEPLGHASLRDWMLAPYSADTCGLGWDLETVKKLLSFKHPRESLPEVAKQMSTMKEVVREAFVGQLGRHGTNQHGDRNTNSMRSDAADYVLARLKRDGETELYEAVLSEQMSANEAAIHAGYRKRKISVPVDAHAAARAIRRHFHPDEVALLIKELDSR